jgi:hypothetical protein
MPGKWRAYYFDQLGAAMDAGPVGETAIRKLSPMTFVVADVADVLSWSLVTGCGVALLHGAVTRLGAPQDTLTFTVGSVGAALLAPIIKDSAVSLLCDIGELWERRHSGPEQPQPDDAPIPSVMVKTENSNGGGTWKFYTPPVRKSGEPIPPAHIKAVARRAMSENFVIFSERHFTEVTPISGPDFRLFQADLVRRGWASKTGNKVKVEPAGRAMLIKIATTPHSPTPVSA